MGSNRKRSPHLFNKTLFALVYEDIIMPQLFQQTCVALNNSNLIFTTDEMSIFFDLRKFSQAHGEERLYSNLSDHHFLVGDALFLSSESLSCW